MQLYEAVSRPRHEPALRLWEFVVPPPGASTRSKDRRNAAGLHVPHRISACLSVVRIYGWRVLSLYAGIAGDVKGFKE